MVPIRRENHSGALSLAMRMSDGGGASPTSSVSSISSFALSFPSLFLLSCGESKNYFSLTDSLKLSYVPFSKFDDELTNDDPKTIDAPIVPPPHLRLETFDSFI